MKLHTSFSFTIALRSYLIGMTVSLDAYSGYTKLKKTFHYGPTLILNLYGCETRGTSYHTIISSLLYYHFQGGVIYGTVTVMAVLDSLIVSQWLCLCILRVALH